MRPFLLTLILSPLLRTTAASYAKRAAIPVLQHPICRRNFTCAAPAQQDFQTVMADLNKEELGEVDRLAEPAEKECEMLGKNAALQEEKAEEEKKEEEPKLPKLSAADFRAYNSMAEHMEYFVSFYFLFPSDLEFSPCFHLLIKRERKLTKVQTSITTSANPGQCSTTPASTTSGPPTSP